ncbi:uncharacterized protein LOC115720378 [Cannabis sativa]|uniref:uncharacterized protein LOC115720378 n=1 Tax=Cannabis sativa TaxID=3483 RepID=UPI0029CA2D12|nr:uncharacterized protein LOC115720378 [Cannabis sativa]
METEAEAETETTLAETKPEAETKRKNWGRRFGGGLLRASERVGSKGRDQFIPVISSLVNARGLISLPIQGDRLTWDNHRSGPNHVKSALDKGLANGDWVRLFPKAVLCSFQTANTDHRPLCLYSGGLGETIRRNFKFEEAWTRDERSKLVVDYAWKSVSFPWAPARIFKKIGATRIALMHWNRTQFGNLDTQIRDLERRLDCFQKLPVGSRDWELEKELRNSLNEARARKEVYWKQRARISWLKEGDKCSKFFFISASIKGRRNAIESILNKDNVWITKRELIGNEFLEFFKGIFRGPVIDVEFNCNGLVRDRLSLDDQADLIRRPSHEEIRATLFAMSSNKAPGPDGMSVLFFKHYWDSVGYDFCNAVSNFFITGRMHKGVNATNIVLIPKVQNPKRPNHSRLIYLCNVVYKVISKIIANRIKPLLPKLICPTQAAFVPGRAIQDNNVIAQEIVHSFNRKKGREGLFAIKIDLMKAYDRLSWGFIHHVLDCFDVPLEFRTWVSQCISTTSLNACLNGGSVGKIFPSCGLRQGDPLSPYLFIWAAKILSRILEDAQRSKTISGIRLSRGGLILSHIFFADDLILVGKANLEEAKGYWDCLENFCAWSGQKVNKMKTSIFFSKNTPNVMKQRIKDLLGIGSPEEKVQYLGLPLFRSRQKDADFNFILDNLMEKLHGWKAKTLSKAGRATLKKSVGLALPLYAMQTTKLSNRLATKIDGLVRDFWWGSEKGNHGLYLKAWDKLCLPNSLGGLGFRKSKEMNQAFLAKWGWNLLTGNQSLCCRILEAKYLKGKSFLECDPKASDSWFWKNVTKARTIICKGACKRVADGQETNIWSDPWIAHLKGFTPISNGRIMNRESKVAELLQSNGGWNIQKVNSYFHQETVSAILKGGSPTGMGKDIWFWTLESNGQFSYKSSYRALAEDRVSPREVAPSLWTKLWNSKIPERLKFLWWCILSKALPIRSVIGRRFPIEDECCPLCGTETETMEHLFLSCNFAFHLWRSSPWGIFPICDIGIRMWDWVKFLWDLGKKGINEQEVFLYASIIIDTIWRTRNEKVHNNCPADVIKSIDTIRFSFADHHAYLLPCPIPCPKEVWRPPPLDWVKLNCDIRVGLDSMCAAVVARDHVGKVIWVVTSKLDFSNALCGEAMACCLALQEAKARGVKFLILESDSRVVINALNGKDSRWEIDNYVSFCQITSPFFIGCTFAFVSRQCNFMAHNVAKWAFSHQRFGSVPLSSMPETIFCNDREV